jgi:8-oxo-dGTP pyrophosphatase MutT (NUDIX family)
MRADSIAACKAPAVLGNFRGVTQDNRISHPPTALGRSRGPARALRLYQIAVVRATAAPPRVSGQRRGARTRGKMVRRDIRYQAAIIQDHHVLLLRVAERDGSTFWLPPGGGREGEETAEACVCREVREETSLSVDVQQLLFADPAIPGDTYDHLHTFLCRIHGGTASPGVEPETDTAEHSSIREVGWFDLREPASWPPAPAMGLITCSWLERVRVELGYA